MCGLLKDEYASSYKEKIRTDFVLHKDKVHMMPVAEALLSGLKVVKMGDFPGEIKETAKGRVFTPSQALALELDKEKVRPSRFLSFTREDPRLQRYLRCETVMLEEAECDLLDEGEYVIVACEDPPLGFAKKQGTALKNAYPKAWRLV